MNPSCGLSTLITKVIFLSALDISCAVSVAVFALDSPEREKREGSTTPCGVKDVVGPGSRTPARLAAEKTECPLQRTTTLITRTTGNLTIDPIYRFVQSLFQLPTVTLISPGKKPASSTVFLSELLDLVYFLFFYYTLLVHFFFPLFIDQSVSSATEGGCVYFIGKTKTKCGTNS